MSHEQVSRSDSLPGIALKYGISLADLRKANQLWASDPVQLRQVLYIPIHLTSVKRNIRPVSFVYHCLFMSTMTLADFTIVLSPNRTR